MTIEPALAILNQSRRNRIFLNKKPFDIVYQILQEQLFTAYPHFKLDAPDSVIKSLVLNSQNDMTMQYQESDFAFISRLLHQIGVYYYFTSDKDTHTMHCVSLVSQLTALPGVIECDKHAQRHATTITSWKSIHNNFSENIVIDTYDPSQASTLLQYGDVDSSKLNYFEFPGVQKNKNEAEELVQNKKSELESHHNYYIGTTGRLDLLPGVYFTMDNGKGDHNDYVVTSVEWKANGPAQTQVRTDQKITNDYSCIFHAIDAQASNYQPMCSFEKPVIQGLQTAVVIAPVGHPIMVNEVGQVKVRFMWENDANSAENCAWIRVMQSNAGQNWGMIWVPRVDDEVMVSFQNGDIDHPLIVGSAYNSSKMPALDMNQQAHTTAIKMASISKDATDSTRSNELIFNNDMDNESITIIAQRDFTQVIQNDAMTVVEGASQTQVLQGNMLVKVEQGALVAQASKSITLQVGGTELVLNPSSISLIASVIYLNPSSSGSGTPSNLEGKVNDAQELKTKQYNVIQNDIISSDPPPASTQHNSLKNKLEIGALAASIVAAVPFDATGAGEAEQAAAGAEIATLENVGSELETKATGFSGRNGFELSNSEYQPLRNNAASINNKNYSGHALDQMQNRGIPLSVVDDTIENGEQFETNRPNTIGHYDPVNKIRVISNSKTGRIITVIKGAK